MLTPQQIADGSDDSLQAALAQARINLPNVIVAENRRELEEIITNIIKELNKRGIHTK